VRLTASDVAEATEGVIVAGDAGAVADGFTNDSRQVTPAPDGGAPGFVALTAARDGNDFVGDAFQRGATVAIVTRPLAIEPPPGGALVLVGDALEALARLGRRARARLASTTVVGITGSAGKTATKDLTAAALAPARRVHASHLSFNNEAGVPLTLLSAPLETEVLVAELGARFAGNIAELCAIATPNIGVITNLGLAHSGLLGGPAGIAAVKGELLDDLPADGFAVIPAGDPFTPALADRTRARVVRVGPAGTPDADVTTSAVVLDEELRPAFTLESPWGSLRARVPLRGEHQVGNAAMAATVALALGASPESIAEGLGSTTGAPWRMDLVRTARGAVVLNDAYNASPTSTAAALRAFAALAVPGRRIAVLGEMLELGDASDAEHEAIGRLAATTGVDVLVLVGAATASIGRGARAVASPADIEIIEVDEASAATAVVTGLLGADDAVLVKASRAAGLEQVALALTATGAAA
jgi:UDP-N-acetylmuramoyl-tripeptide--D-alanyl-D-alanine ligase